MTDWDLGWCRGSFRVLKRKIKLPRSARERASSLAHCATVWTAQESTVTQLVRFNWTCTSILTSQMKYILHRNEMMSARVEKRPVRANGFSQGRRKKNNHFVDGVLVSPHNCHSWTVRESGRSLRKPADAEPEANPQTAFFFKYIFARLDHSHVVRGLV